MYCYHGDSKVCFDVFFCGQQVPQSLSAPPSREAETSLSLSADRTKLIIGYRLITLTQN